MTVKKTNPTNGTETSSLTTTEALELKVKALEGQLRRAKKKIKIYDRVTTNLQKKRAEKIEETLVQKDAKESLMRRVKRGRPRKFEGYDPSKYNPMMDEKPKEYDIIDKLLER